FDPAPLICTSYPKRPEKEDQELAFPHRAVQDRIRNPKVPKHAGRGTSARGKTPNAVNGLARRGTTGPLLSQTGSREVRPEDHARASVGGRAQALTETATMNALLAHVASEGRVASATANPKAMESYRGLDREVVLGWLTRWEDALPANAHAQTEAALGRWWRRIEPEVAYIRTYYPLLNLRAVETGTVLGAFELINRVHPLPTGARSKAERGSEPDGRAPSLAPEREAKGRNGGRKKREVPGRASASRSPSGRASPTSRREGAAGTARRGERLPPSTTRAKAAISGASDGDVPSSGVPDASGPPPPAGGELAADPKDGKTALPRRGRTFTPLEDMPETERELLLQYWKLERELARVNVLIFRQRMGEEGAKW
ncbi:hypothetical protein SCHPADRAFT_987277, partial [Schizopora paradoxa]